MGVSDLGEAGSVRDLSELFSRAKSAHVAYERDVLLGTDPDWAGWYAVYLLDNGAHSIPGWPVRCNEPGVLSALLTQLDEDQQANAPHEHWPDYYARKILGNS